MEALPWTGFTEDCEVEGNPDPSEGAGVCKPRLPTHNNWIGKYSYEGNKSILRWFSKDLVFLSFLEGR